VKKVVAAVLVFCLLSVCTCAEELDLLTPPAAEPAPSATAESIPRLSSAPLVETSPIPLSCGAALLLEPQSGQIIFEMNSNVPRPVASVTKVMTILLALEAIEQGRIHPEQLTTISQSAAGMGGSQVLLDVGEVQSVDILLKSVIVGSANDASVALAELMYGSEELCVARMNERAARLGMTGTHFKNCTGLPVEGQQTTARDVAIMTMAMLAHDRYFDYSTIWLDEIDHGDGRITQLTNTNKLTRLYDGCDGGKTGSTDEAGFCISATAKRGDVRLIAVVLGADSSSERFDIAADMLDYGFANYRIYPVARRGTKIKGTIPVEGGRPDSVNLVLDEDLTLLISKGAEQNIQLVPQLPEAVQAPVETGQLIGHVHVEMNGKVLAKLPVTAASASEIKGISGNLKKLLQDWVL